MTDELKDLKIRPPSEMKAWLAARAKLNHRSMNAEVINLLGQVLDNDPLTRIRILHENGRYVTASAFTREQFRAYSGKSPAQAAAVEAMKIIGRDERSIVDLSGTEAG